jgi:UDP-N-acetylmuramate dehydrogenase
MINIQENIILSPFTTFKIGGAAKFFVVVKTQEEMIEALNHAFKNNLKYFILGGGANVLFLDEGFDGLTIKNEMRKIAIHGDLVEAESGAPMSLVVNESVDAGLQGLEYFSGHPGSVGGSIFINAHSRDEDKNIILLGSYVYKAKIYNIAEKKVEKVDTSYFDFIYDYSKLKDTHDILLSVFFELTSGFHDDLKERAGWIMNYRRETQDYGGHTAGCTFQNTEKGPAGKLIDECGLKGVKFGGAQISEKHANFIINDGSAKAADVLHLIQVCKDRVKEKFGVELYEEIVIV